MNRLIAVKHIPYGMMKSMLEIYYLKEWISMKLYQFKGISIIIKNNYKVIEKSMAFSFKN